MSLIKIGVVTKVDPVNFVVSVDMFDGSSAKDIQCASTYFNSSNGCGIVSIPEVDSMCIIQEINGEQIVAGFISDKDQRYTVTNGEDPDLDDTKLPGYKCGRPSKWNPGDVGIVSGNRKGAYFKIGSDGIISLYSAPLCSAHFLPAPFNRAEITTQSLNWKLGEGELSLITDNKAGRSTFTLEVKSPDQRHKSTIVIGAGYDGSTMTINISEKIQMEYTKEGGLTASFSDDINLTTQKAINITSGNSITINSGNLTIKK